MSYYLYRKKCEKSLCCPKMNVFSFTPSIFRPFIQQENKSIRLFFARLYFILVTRRCFTIYYVLSDEGLLMHTSCVMGKNFKFPFMQKNNFEIGPCVTQPYFRKNGIYTMVLNYISSLKEYENAFFYMLVHENNIPSIRGIEKANFQRIGVVRKSKILKVYRKI